jgi:DNA-binding NarL/FixJ family response regulator
MRIGGRWVCPFCERELAAAAGASGQYNRSLASKRRWLMSNDDRARRDAEIVRLWGEGWAQTKIAQKFGLTPARVNFIVNAVKNRRQE